MNRMIRVANRMDSFGILDESLWDCIGAGF